MRHPGGTLGKKMRRVEEVIPPEGKRKHVCADASLKQVLLLMATYHLRSLCVVNGKGRLAGVIPGASLGKIRRRDYWECQAKEVMEPPPALVKKGTPVEKAASIIKEKKVEELAVVNGKGHPLGIVSRQDLERPIH